MIPILDLKRQYYKMKEEIDNAVQGVIENGVFVLGENVEEFEREFARYCGVSHGVGVSSGTEALHLSLLAYGIGKGDEVITAPNTAVPTVLPISFTGATPVFVDISSDTYAINTSKIEDCINNKTKAIIPVHLYGHPVDMSSLMEIAEAHNLRVIEDACQAHGAEYKNKKVGSFGDVGCFSFYPSKNLGAYGDGGIAVSQNKEIIEKLRMLRNYGQTSRYRHLFKGFNSRLDEIQAAILRVKLKRLDMWNNLRREKAKLYAELLDDTMVIIPTEKEYYKHVYHLYVIRSKYRDELKDWLRQNGILTNIHYPIPVHLQEAYNELPYTKGDFPITEECAGEVLSLPMFPELTEDEIENVSNVLNAFLKGRK